jgi:hypothetical protein
MSAAYAKNGFPILKSFGMNIKDGKRGIFWIQSYDRESGFPDFFGPNIPKREKCNT